MSPRSEEQNALIKDERREQILTAALKVFAKKGLAAAKVGDIAARADVSHGLVYHYFASKEDVFLELLRRAMYESVQSMLRVEAVPLGPLEKVRAVAQYILGGIESFEDSAYYFLIVIQAYVMEGPKHKEEVLGESAVALQAMVRILQEGQRIGEVREGDAMEMSMTFFAAIHGLAIYKLSTIDFHMPDPELLVSIVKRTS